MDYVAILLPLGFTLPPPPILLALGLTLNPPPPHPAFFGPNMVPGIWNLSSFLPVYWAQYIGTFTISLCNHEEVSWEMEQI